MLRPRMLRVLAGCMLVSGIARAGAQTAPTLPYPNLRPDTRLNGVPFAPSATTDTTNAGNISSGTLPAARLPALNAVRFIGDGSTTQFYFSTPIDPTRVFVYVGGLAQAPQSYSVNATTLTFTEPPPAGVYIAVGQANLASSVVGGSGGGGGSATGAPQVYALTGDGTTTQFPLSPAPSTLDRYTVVVGGAPQSRAACQLTASALVCAAPPPTAVAIDVTDGP